MTKREKIIKAVKEIDDNFTVNFEGKKISLNIYPYSYEMKRYINSVSYKDIYNEIKELIQVYKEVI